MTTMKMNGMTGALAAAGMLLAGWAGADGPATAVSDATPLDTRSLSAVAADQDQALDSRSFTVDWSEPRNLNTRAKRVVI